MVKKYVYGHPFPTDAVVEKVNAESSVFPYGQINVEKGFCFTYHMEDKERIYGLGQTVRGINKRGYLYESFASDNGYHFEDAKSLYGAHNFILITGGKESFGLFFDDPARLTFDLGYSKYDEIRVSSEYPDMALYLITGDNTLDIVKCFRKIIGRSYIPPKFAFGYGQCRWGYKSREEFYEVVREHRQKHIPLDMVYMDIDYMDHYKDFTVNTEEFPDFKAFVEEMRKEHIRLVPIIDAGVKVEKGYSVYEEGVEKGYFCKRADGSDFEACVWPGYTHFPDILNPDARMWFGKNYRALTEAGIEAFWNDMCEPAIFHTPEGMKEVVDYLKTELKDSEEIILFAAKDIIGRASNSEKDYKNFYHKAGDEMVNHYRVHNLFGYGMTRAAAEAFDEMYPDHRLLMFSRSSYIGAHRYGGIWMGDNMSWWEHLLLNLRMLPSLNMCGFLYTGADLGGFASNATRDLLLRWLALGVFTPLMRNHSALGTRRQEFYQFEKPEDFKAVISVRYRLIPYLYSEFVKAAMSDEMLFKPLAFVYPNDPIACQEETQLMLGDDIMIAPVYQQNAVGRSVYLPEEMMLVKFMADGSLDTKVLSSGYHFAEVALNEVILFVKKDHAIPVAKAAEYVEALDEASIEMVGFEGASYDLFSDDGYDKKINLSDHIKTLVHQG